MHLSFSSQINYIVSDSEFHILNTWRQEDQSTHEVIQGAFDPIRTQVDTDPVDENLNATAQAILTVELQSNKGAHWCKAWL